MPEKMFFIYALIFVTPIFLLFYCFLILPYRVLLNENIDGLESDEVDKIIDSI